MTTRVFLFGCSHKVYKGVFDCCMLLEFMCCEIGGLFADRAHRHATIARGSSRLSSIYHQPTRDNLPEPRVPQIVHSSMIYFSHIVNRSRIASHNEDDGCVYGIDSVAKLLNESHILS
jgi:hypothetical protein